MGEVLNLVESYIKDSNGNVKEGVAKASKRLVEEMRKPGFKSDKVSIREIFDATVVKEHGADIVTAQNARIAEAIGHSNFPYITKELIHTTLIPAYELAMNGVETLVTEGSTNRADTVDVAGIRGISNVPRVYPGQNYPSADFGEKNVRVSLAKFGQILDLEAELILADQTGEILNRARAAGDALGEHRHRFIVETAVVAPRTAMEEAASTAYVYGGTAYAYNSFYSNDHSSTFDDKQVNDNLAASSAIGSVASWDTAFGLLMGMKDDRGKQITVMPKIVLVNPINYRKAWHQAVDDGLAAVDSANRGGNFYRQKANLQVVASPFVGAESTGATTDWYMGDFAKQMLWLWQFRPTVDSQGATSDAAFERDVVARFKYFYSGGVAHLDYRYVVRCTA